MPLYTVEIIIHSFIRVRLKTSCSCPFPSNSSLLLCNEQSTPFYDVHILNKSRLSLVLFVPHTCRPLCSSPYEMSAWGWYEELLGLAMFIGGCMKCG